MAGTTESRNENRTRQTKSNEIYDFPLNEMSEMEINKMTATNNTIAASQSNASAMNRSDSSAQTGSIMLLSAVIALVRAALVIFGAVSLGAAARYFFPEMFAIPSNPIALLSVVAIDTFAIVAGVLLARAKSSRKSA